MKSYQPSGKHSPKAIINCLLFNLILTPVISYLLIISLQIKFALVAVLIFIFFPFVFGGLLTAYCINAGKVRNRSLALIFALTSGILSLYFQYSAGTMGPSMRLLVRSDDAHNSVSSAKTLF